MNEMIIYVALGFAGAVLYLVAGMALALCADKYMSAAFERVMPDSILLALVYWVGWPMTLLVVVLANYHAKPSDRAVG